MTASNLYLYLNGEIVAQAADSSTGGVASNDTDFYIGYDSETGRSNSNQFAKVRVYNKALSADELNGQDAYDKAEAEAPAITPDNENVVLWLDFATLGYNDVPVVDEDGVTLSPEECRNRPGHRPGIHHCEGRPDGDRKSGFCTWQPQPWKTCRLCSSRQMGLIPASTQRAA